MPYQTRPCQARPNQTKRIMTPGYTVLLYTTLHCSKPVYILQSSWSANLQKPEGQESKKFGGKTEGFHKEGRNLEEKRRVFMTLEYQIKTTKGQMLRICVLRRGKSVDIG